MFPKSQTPSQEDSLKKNLIFSCIHARWSTSSHEPSLSSYQLCGPLIPILSIKMVELRHNLTQFILFIFWLCREYHKRKCKGFVATLKALHSLLCCVYHLKTRDLRTKVNSLNVEPGNKGTLPGTRGHYQAQGDTTGQKRY